MALKSSEREPFAVFVIVAALIYWGTEIIGVSIAVGWIAATIRGVAGDLKRTYLLTEFNRTMCEFEGDLEELQRKLTIVLEVELYLRSLFGEGGFFKFMAARSIL